MLVEQMSSTLFTIAKDVKIQVEFNPAQVAQYRLIGYENRALREEDFNNDQIDAGEIGAGHQVTAIYEIVPDRRQGLDRAAPLRAPARRRPRPEQRTGLREAALQAARRNDLEADRARGSRSLLARAGAPRGDMAFAVAVAAFGQKLRGDPLLGTFSYPQIAALAGSQQDFWRQEFGRLVGVAGSLDTRTAQSSGDRAAGGR